VVPRDELSRMKPSAYLINAARTTVGDEVALHDALQDRQIAGAALDVFRKGPLPADGPWLRLDNGLLTPHVGGTADGVKAHHSAMVVEDLGMLIDGECPARLVGPEVFPFSLAGFDVE
jgi:D-3-phosphoglycerate dehydrogenase